MLGRLDTRWLTADGSGSVVTRALIFFFPLGLVTFLCPYYMKSLRYVHEFKSTGLSKHIVFT
jgi:hypothetical protein